METYFRKIIVDYYNIKFSNNQEDPNYSMNWLDNDLVGYFNDEIAINDKITERLIEISERSVIDMKYLNGKDISLKSETIVYKIMKVMKKEYLIEFFKQYMIQCESS